MRSLTVAAVLVLAGAGAAAAQEGPMDLMGGFRGPIDVVAIDTDGNDSLSRAELQARAIERLGRADANGDGWLDRAEILAIVPVPPGRFLDVFAEDRGEAMADRLIALMGGTESGRIEVVALADRRVNALLAAADTDRDAAISMAEARAFTASQRDHRPHGPRGGGDRERERNRPWAPEPRD